MVFRISQVQLLIGTAVVILVIIFFEEFNPSAFFPFVPYRDATHSCPKLVEGLEEGHTLMQAVENVSINSHNLGKEVLFSIDFQNSD
jgi:hypothetical protein